MSPTALAQSTLSPEQIAELRQIIVRREVALLVMSKIPMLDLPRDLESSSLAEQQEVIDLANTLAYEMGLGPIQGLKQLFEKRNRRDRQSRHGNDDGKTDDDQADATPVIPPSEPSDDDEPLRETRPAFGPALCHLEVEVRIGSSRRRQESTKANIVAVLKLLMMIGKFLSVFLILSNTQSNLARFSLLCDRWYVVWH